MFKLFYKLNLIKNALYGQKSLVDKFKRRELAFIDTDFWWRYSSTSRKIIKKRVDQFLNIFIYYLSFEFFDYCFFIFLFFSLLYNYSFIGFLNTHVFSYVFLYLVYIFVLFIYFLICLFFLFLFMIIYIFFFLFVYLKNKSLFYLLRYIFLEFFYFSFFLFFFNMFNIFLRNLLLFKNNIIVSYNNFTTMIFLYYVKYYKKFLNYKAKDLKTKEAHLKFLYKLLKKLPVNRYLVIYYRKKQLGSINIIITEEDIKSYTWRDSDLDIIIKRERTEKIKRYLRFILFFNRTKIYKSLKFNFFRSIEYVIISLNLLNFLNKDKHKIYTAFFTIWAWEPNYINDWDYMNWTQTYSYRIIRYKLSFYDLRGFFFYLSVDLLHYISPIIRFLHFIYWESYFLQIRQIAAPFRSDFERSIIYYFVFWYHIIWKNPEVERRYYKRKLKKFLYLFVYLDVFEFFFNFNNLIYYYKDKKFFKQFHYLFNIYVYNKLKIFYINIFSLGILSNLIKKIYVYLTYLFINLKFFFKNFNNFLKILIIFLKNIFFYCFIKSISYIFSKKKFRRFLKKNLKNLNNFKVFNKVDFDVVRYKKRKYKLKLSLDFNFWLYLFYNYERNRFIDPTQINFRSKKIREFNEYIVLLIDAIQLYRQVFRRIARYKRLPLYRRLFREFNVVSEIDTSHIFIYDNKFRKSYINEKVKIIKKEYKYSKRNLVKKKYLNLNFLYYYNTKLKKKNLIYIKKKYKKRRILKKKNKIFKKC